MREGLLVQAPAITAQPQDATVSEGATVQLSVKAGVSRLQYCAHAHSPPCCCVVPKDVPTAATSASLSSPMPPSAQHSNHQPHPPFLLPRAWRRSATSGSATASA